MSVAENPHSSDPQTPQDVTAELCIHSLVLGNESMMHNQINVEKNAERSSKFPQPDVLPLDLETLVFDWKLLGHS